MTSFRSRCQVVSTELFPPVVIVPSAKIQFPKFWGENLSSQCEIAKAIGNWLIVGRNGLVTHQPTQRKVKWFSVTTKGLVQTETEMV